MEDPKPVQTVLPLPYELRLNIYQQLLVPASQPIQLYHDRLGRSRPTNLQPAILYISKSTYEEAAPILYERNVFKIDIFTPMIAQCTGGAPYPDDCGDVLTLIKLDEEEVDRKEKDFQKRVYEADCLGGLIRKKCLSRMRHVEVITSYEAVWGRAMSGQFLGQIGGFLLPDVLKTLAMDDTPAEVAEFKKKNKTLAFTAIDEVIDAGIRRSLFGIGQDVVRKPEKEKEVGKLWDMLALVHRTRNVELHEARLVNVDVCTTNIEEDEVYETNELWTIKHWNGEVFIPEDPNYWAIDELFVREED